LVDFSMLAEPVAESTPCGPDCEYEGDFLALLQAVQGKAEQQFGDTVIPAVEPDWRTVEQLATSLLGRTKDLRVAGLLSVAATHLKGIAGFSAGVGLLLLLCERYWDEVHPRMIIDGEDDPYLRINALAAISDAGEGSGLVRALRAQLLASLPLPVSVRDVEMTVAKDVSARYSDAQIQSVLADAWKAGSPTLAAFEEARASVTAFAVLTDEHFATGESPDLSVLKSLFKVVGGVIDRTKPGTIAVAEVSDGKSEDDLTSQGLALQTPKSITGEINSREDVRRALQRICDYLERHEPSNPAALFAQRALGLLDRGFLDIMQELSPDSVGHLKMLTGAKLPNE